MLHYRGQRMRRSDLKDSDPYAAAWSRLEHAQVHSTGLFLGLFFGGGAVTGLLVAALGTRAPDWLWPVAMLPWMVAAIVKSQGAIRVPCPRCGKPFNSTSWSYNGLARRCMHCGLPKWAPADPHQGPSSGT
jgi:ribosomal protein L37E